jgi:hypothetical protein
MTKHDNVLLEAVARVMKDYVAQRIEPLQQELLDKQAQIDRMAAVRGTGAGPWAAGAAQPRPAIAPRGRGMTLTPDQVADTSVADMRAQLAAAFDELAAELDMSIRAEVVHGVPTLCMPAVERSVLLH